MAATFNKTDLEFILQQIFMAEQGQAPDSPHLAFGIREVAGTNNNTVPGNEAFGSSDQLFRRETDPLFQNADAGSSYAQTSVNPLIFAQIAAAQVAVNNAVTAASAAQSTEDAATAAAANATSSATSAAASAANAHAEADAAAALDQASASAAATAAATDAAALAAAAAAADAAALAAHAEAATAAALDQAAADAANAAAATDAVALSVAAADAAAAAAAAQAAADAAALAGDPDAALLAAVAADAAAAAAAAQAAADAAVVLDQAAADAAAAAASTDAAALAAAADAADLAAAAAHAAADAAAAADQAALDAAVAADATDAAALSAVAAAADVIAADTAQLAADAVSAAQAATAASDAADAQLAAAQATLGDLVDGALIDAGYVIDADPRIISNLITDQTAANLAAVEAQKAALAALGDGYKPVGLELGANNTHTPPVTAADGSLFIPNVTPDAGLSAPFNTWFTLFGQFFDHGLDLVNKGGSGTVYIPLQPDDPLIPGKDGILNDDPLTAVDEAADNLPASQRFMVLTRATNQAGDDGLIGTADDLHEATNAITPFVDQSQTYSSHPSHQVFLREYVVGADNLLHSTGKMLSHTNADGSQHMATWADVKANALTLGILLTDRDVNNVPLLATDAYGNVQLGPNGFAQVIVMLGDGSMVKVEGNALGLDIHNPGALLNGTAVGTGVAFINDKAFTADPFKSNGVLLPQDIDGVAGNAVLMDAQGNKLEYDNELLDAHYVAGDGRVNENIGLTAVHDIFHSEHNRLVDQIKTMVQAELANGDTSFASNWVLASTNLADGIQANEWNGERLFQAAKYGTETQYQHLVFEEFARKISPTIHLFGNNDIHLDPAIMAEFAHVVYRFGHSMLDETVNRLNADGTVAGDGDPGTPGNQQMTLIDAFTNPLAYLNAGADAAGQLVRGSTNQIGNEIDEFVTGALRNNLLGLPLDLAALNIARGRDTGVAPLNLVRNEIYSQTGDATLKPYANWDEFGQYLKHPASLINFVAAYGTHSSIVNATTLADKRAAALDLVLKGSDSISDGENNLQNNPLVQVGSDAYNFMHSLDGYSNNKTAALAIHDAAGNVPQWSTGSVTGLDNVDLWIGGLAEKQNLFGGLLGSTFNFIFELQMETLQDADRMYYLPRVEGMHWGFEVEGNSFASLIMANTSARHLSANIFLTPEYVVEAKDYVTHNVDGSITIADPSTWLRNPISNKLLVDVSSDGTIRFLGDDNFFGNTMVIGGTEQDDKLQAGHADDDTVYGDGGNDTLDGGGGNDIIYGGTGDDFISDIAGDDIIHGDSGNDVINGGIGDDSIFGNDGNDLIYGGLGIDAVVGGEGNDIIYGGEDDDEMLGNEGDDWMEGGEGGDILVGDGAAPTGQVPLFSSNDVLDGGLNGDKMQGFTGDDIMLGLGGFDKFIGLLGFDWGSFEKETHGVSVDMELREFIPNTVAAAGDAVRDFWVATEGVSGTNYDDYLQGSNDSKIDPFNELNNVNLITGLANYFPANTPVAFSGGNIMLGGGGSDIIFGRGGNDIIDGDARLHVALTKDANGNVYAGSQIIREILFDEANPGDVDTAAFTDVSTNYQITFAVAADGFTPLVGNDGNPVLVVSHVPVGAVPVGTILDGTDILYNIERLQFADVIIDNPFLFAPPDFAAQGLLTLESPAGTPLPAATPPTVGTLLTASSTVFDIDGVLTDLAATIGGGNIPLNDMQLQWQFTTPAHIGWIDITGATGATFNPTDYFVGSQLRLQGSFTDGQGVKETVWSAPTAVVAPNPAINHAPAIARQVALPGIPDTTANANAPFTYYLPFTAVFLDDRDAAGALGYTFTLADGSPLATAGLAYAGLVPDATGGVAGVITGTPAVAYVGKSIDILVTATDLGGLSVTDTFSINVLPDQAPVITSNGGGDSAHVSVAENTIAVTTVTAIDINALDVLTYAIVGGADAAQFAIDGAGVLTFNTAPDFEAPADVGADNVYDVVVRVSDPTGLTDTQTIAVTVAPVNDINPVITSDGGGDNAAAAVAENSTYVTTVTATDADLPLPQQTLTYSISGGADAAKFTINSATGVLSFISAPNYEAPTDVGANNVYDVIVQVSDDGGPSGIPVLTDTQAIAVIVTNLEGNSVVGTLGADTMNLLTGTVSAGMTVNGNIEAAGAPGATPENDNIVGLDGNDILVGLADGDTIDGGDGNDTLVGGEGRDTLTGGSGDDTFVFAAAAGISSDSAGVGKDVVTDFAPGADRVLLQATGVSNFSVASNISATAGTNGVFSADLNNNGVLTDVGDIQFASTQSLGVDATAASAAARAAVMVDLSGTGGNDTLIGGANNDRLDGAGGNDLLAGLGGEDTLIGGLGIDTASYAASVAAVTVNLTTNVNTGGDAQGDSLSSIENLTGSGSNDSLTGDAAANVLDGSGGNDTLAGLAGSDTLIGGTGIDTADYTSSSAAVSVNLSTNANTGGDAEGDSLSGIENLVGSANDDALTGNGVANVLDGGLGNDTLAGLAGADVLIGGAGVDTASYLASAAAVTVNLSTNVNSGGDALGDSLSGIENIIGSNNDDSLTGDANGNLLNGGEGNDVFRGGLGNDTIDGGIHNDTVNYTIGDGADVIDGGADNDTLTISGTAANDTLHVITDGIFLTGFEGSSIVNVEITTANLGAGTADELSYAGSTAGVLVDLLLGGAATGFNLVTGVENITGGSGDDNLTGDNNANVLTGGLGNDSLHGAGGSDVLVATIGDGDDSIDGGLGTDTYNLSATTAAATIDLSSISLNATSAQTGSDTLIGIENVVGSQGDDSINGSAGANAIDGQAGNDTLTGLGGADTLNGGSGNDTFNYAIGDGADVIDGGADTDTLAIIGGAAGETLTVTYGGTALTAITGLAAISNVESVTLDLTGGTDTLSYGTTVSGVTVDLGNQTASGFTSVANVENATGGAGNDLLIGSAGVNTLNGGSGNDTITGGAGNDALNGGDNDDTFNYVMGDGADAVNGGLGADTLAITGLAGNDDTLAVTLVSGALTVVAGGSVTGVESITVDLGANAAVGDTLSYAATGAPFSVSVNLAASTASGFTAVAGIENVTGGAGTDTLIGDGTANRLDGGAGSDTLDGGAGDDTLIGGAGTDTASYANATGAVTVAINVAAQNTVGAGTDTLTGIENLVGSNFGDTLTGDAAANLIDGQGGNDTINGGAGVDTLNGGAGDDTILYALGSGADVIDGGANSDTLAIVGSGAGDAITVAYSGAGFASITGAATFSNVEALTVDLAGGSDALSYGTTSVGVTVNLSNVSSQTASGFTSIANIENVTGGSGNDLLVGSNLTNSLNGGTGADTLVGGGGTDSINTGAANDDIADVVRFTDATDFGAGTTAADTIANFDATGSAAQIDKLQFGGSLNAFFDNGIADDIFQFNSANAATNNTNQAVNLASIEALFLDGSANDGVANNQLTNATSVANEFNAEFAITAAAGQSTLLVINDTNGNSASVWQYIENGGAEIQANELSLIALINANATVTTGEFVFV